jgi:hypothetical protein
MKNINKLDNYSLVKKILSNIPSGLDSNLKVINQQALPFISELSNRLELDSTETVLFSCIIHSQMTQNKCETSRISEILNTPLEHLYTNQKKIRNLNFKNAVEISFGSQEIESYFVKRSVRNAFFLNNINPSIKKINYSFLEILEFVHDTFSQFKMNSDDVEEFKFYREKLKYILKNNKNLSEVKMLNKTKLKLSEQIILMIIVLSNSIKKGAVNVLSVFDSGSDNLDESFNLFYYFKKKENIFIN